MQWELRKLNLAGSTYRQWAVRHSLCCTVVLISYFCFRCAVNQPWLVKRRSTHGIQLRKYFSSVTEHSSFKNIVQAMWRKVTTRWLSLIFVMSSVAGWCLRSLPSPYVDNCLGTLDCGTKYISWKRKGGEEKRRKSSASYQLFNDTSSVYLSNASTNSPKKSFWNYVDDCRYCSVHGMTTLNMRESRAFPNFCTKLLWCWLRGISGTRGLDFDVMRLLHLRGFSTSTFIAMSDPG